MAFLYDFFGFIAVAGTFGYSQSSISVLLHVLFLYFSHVKKVKDEHF